ncbi:hypothetical protein Taro_023795 [Colocasia esculenta]|uniref:Uncharacterized protein n=1 Tax=Colocasia esculenta TaxID=4460 RepID=A0A843UYF4_COLES|nr:hypothetical protein [Colocasia esculenta]
MLRREYIAEEIRQHKVNKTKFKEHYNSKNTCKRECQALAKFNSSSEDLQRRPKDITASTPLVRKTRGRIYRGKTTHENPLTNGALPSVRGNPPTDGAFPSVKGISLNRWNSSIG